MVKIITLVALVLLLPKRATAQTFGGGGVGGGGGGGGITSLGGLTGATQTFGVTNDTNITGTIVSSGTNHQFTYSFTGSLAKARQHAATAYTDANNTFGAFRQSFASSASEPALRLVPYAGDPTTPLDGDIWYNSSTNKFRCRVNGSTVDCDTTGGGGVSDGDKGDVVVSGAGSVWTIDAGVVGDSKVAAGVAATKIGGGAVDNTEFGHLNGVTSAIQAQLDAKAAIARTAVSHSATPTYTRTNAIQEFAQTLTSNVTSSTLSGAAAGDLLSFEFTQDSTPRTVVLPTGFPTLALCTTPGSVTVAQYFWTGSAAIERSVNSPGCTERIIRWSDGTTTTFPAGSDTAATLTATQTFTNKSIGASQINSGTMATARLGSGTADNTTFLRGDNTWAVPSGGGGGSLTWSTPIGVRAHIQGIGSVQNIYMVSATQNSSPFPVTFNEFMGTDTAGTAIPYLALNDTATDASLTWNTKVPSGYTSGTLSVALRRNHSTATGNVVWRVRTFCPGALPGYAAEWAWNTATTATDSAAATTMTNTNVVTGVDMTGCSAGSMLLINVTRMTTDGADTNAGIVRLWEVTASL